MKRIALAVGIALAGTASAQAATGANYVTLPSPLAQLSPAPPLGGGASQTSEGFRHRIAARTAVDVALDPRGAPFAITATQRLDVGVAGDYFFTIGAPVTDVEAAAGSASTPGLRAASILWAGFNPGHRTLIARATLDPGVAGTSLPLRIEVGPGSTTLVNATAVVAGSFSAEALVPPLARYLALLGRQTRAGQSPTSGGAYVTSKPEPRGERIVAPLHVSGTVGGQAIDTVVESRLVVRGGGPIRLRVKPVLPAALFAIPAGATGRQLLGRATRAALTVARVRQYDTFLGNPDPSGANASTYVYRSARPPAPPQVAAAAGPAERDWASTLAVAAGLLLAAAGALVAWSRS